MGIYIVLFCIGFANALPLPLLGSTLSIWLAEGGFSCAAIGYFSLLTIPFSLRIVWSPIVESIAPPFFKESPRKGWVVWSLAAIGGALLAMSFLSFHTSLPLFALCVFLLSVASGCLYIAGIAYELDSVDPLTSNMGSACVLSGYRVGLLVAGACALYIAFFAGWEVTYQCMAGLLLIPIGAVLYVREPARSQKTFLERKKAFGQYASKFVGMWQECVVRPGKSLFERGEWKEILCVVLVFKLGDQLAHSVVGPFYLSLGFTKVEIAASSKLWGMCASILGALCAGVFFKKRDSLYALVVASALHAVSLVSLCFLSYVGNSNAWLCFSVALENTTGGMAMALFISYLWRIADKRHASAQYALIWSLFSLKSEVASFLGAMLAHVMSWGLFFGLVAGVSVVSTILTSRARKLSLALPGRGDFSRCQ